MQPSKRMWKTWETPYQLTDATLPWSKEQGKAASNQRLWQLRWTQACGRCPSSRRPLLATRGIAPHLAWWTFCLRQTQNSQAPLADCSPLWVTLKSYLTLTEPLSPRIQMPPKTLRCIQWLGQGLGTSVSSQGASY